MKMNMVGKITRIINYKDGNTEKTVFYNSLLNTGRSLFIQNLLPRPSNEQIYIKNMLFGDGGMQDGELKQVTPEMTQLFGVTRFKKEVVGQVNPEVPTQVVFTMMMNYEEANEFMMNEMALEFNNGVLFNLATFDNFSKTSQMELMWLWELWFV